jgi:molybdopterin synthase catalytic subunit
MIRTAVLERPIDCAALLAEVADVASGATLLFVGTVRDVNEGRAVTGIEYAAYAGMAERELAAIVGERLPASAAHSVRMATTYGLRSGA